MLKLTQLDSTRCRIKCTNISTSRSARPRYSSTLNRIPHELLQIEKTKNPKQMKSMKELIFGKDFTDHMLTVDWTSKSGWSAPKIQPYGKISLDPSCSVFHYAIECFEGMKAYKDSSNNIRLFRPQKNIERLTNSARRIALPTFEPEGFLNCVKHLIKTDSDWVPSDYGYSLYIRPTLIGTQNTLGVGPSPQAMLFIICSPVGPYYPEGWKPVKLLADPSYVRAWPGGTGASKLGGNYAPAILGQVEANKKGYTQVLWLFGPEHEITEVGTMNFFTYWINENGEKELITAPLDGTILPGVTRDSILSLARTWNEFKVSEKKFTMSQLTKALNEGRVIECFGAGTAAVVSPVGLISFQGKDYQVPLDKELGIGKLTKRFADTIMGIQYGNIPHEWSVVV